MTWQPKASQNARAFRLFMESMDVMNEALRFPSGPHVGHIGRVARTVSIELRKLIFDSSPLLHRILQRVRLHPLMAGEALTGDIYENTFQLSIAPGTREGILLGSPSTREWKITVHPLHGLKFHKSEKKWEMHPMFDTDAEPIALQRWLRQRLLCVENREYSLLDTLRFLSTKEAAHVDIEDAIIFKDMERVHFVHTTYYHMVAILTAAYLIREYQASQRVNESQWHKFSDYEIYKFTESPDFYGATFDGVEIEPWGLPNVFHETGISLLNPGETWKAVQVTESIVVRP